jgi:ring-1,2-phenylacetyl-CoA epoxidase subunit PaaB
MKETQGPRFEVFQQDRPDRPHQNVGSVHAPDAEVALLNARNVFVRRPACLSLWVAPTDAILARTSQELEEDSGRQQETAVAGTAEESYYVFQKRSQRRSMTYVTYAGEVTASSPRQALARAVAQYGDGDVYVWWVCPERAITRTSEEDIESLFMPAHTKTYRQPQAYRTYTQMKELKNERPPATRSDE